MTRRVVVIFGPPGAGKTTYARTLGLTIYDRDDGYTEAAFRSQLKRIGADPDARAVIVRTGATLSARQTTRDLVRATEAVLLDPPVEVCHARIKARGRTDPPIAVQLHAAEQWHRKHEPDPAPDLGHAADQW